MRQAVVFFNGECFSGIAFEGEDAYERNIERDREFLTPIIVPQELIGEDVLHVLNSGQKRILKTGVEINVSGKMIEHKKLSKR